MIFTAIATEDVQPNRLLSLGAEQKVSITAAGGTPDFRSTGAIKEGSEVRIAIKNNPVWQVEAGGDIAAGDYVEVGAGGTVVKSAGEGIGYVAESVSKGGVARLVRKFSGGTPGPKGDKGDKGDTGAAGPKGDPGTAGAKGEKGDKGDTGAAGAKGATGATGPAGKDGAPTQAEWDALEARVAALEA